VTEVAEHFEGEKASASTMSQHSLLSWLSYRC